VEGGGKEGRKEGSRWRGTLIGHVGRRQGVILYSKRFHVLFSETPTNLYLYMSSLIEHIFQRKI